jgi:hypothetical protein
MARDHAVDQAGDKQDHKDKGNKFCNFRKSPRQAAKTKDSRNHGKQETCNHPVQHVVTLFC